MITHDRPPHEGLRWASSLMLMAAMLALLTVGWIIEMIIA
jgi:hypothetical protein